VARENSNVQKTNGVHGAVADNPPEQLIVPQF
jgi:hypothetical protein